MYLSALSEGKPASNGYTIQSCVFTDRYSHYLLLRQQAKRLDEATADVLYLHIASKCAVQIDSLQR